MVSSLRRAFDRPILAKKPWGHPDPNGIPQIHNAKFFPLNYPPDFTKKRFLEHEDIQIAFSNRYRAFNDLKVWNLKMSEMLR